MVHVTRATNATYLTDPRGVQNSHELGVEPFAAGGGFARLDAAIRAPVAPDDPAWLREARRLFPTGVEEKWDVRLLEWLTARAVPRRAGAVGLFHVGVSFDKSVSLDLLGLPREERGALAREIVAVVRERLCAAVDAQLARSGADGARKESSRGFVFGFADFVGAWGQPQFHIHAGVPHTTLGPNRELRAIGNVRDALLRAAPEINALVQKDVDGLLRARGVKTELAPDGRHVRVAGFPNELLAAQSPGRAELRARAARSPHAGPTALGYRALEAHRGALRTHPDSYTKGVERVHREVREACRRHGVVPERLRSRAPVTPTPSRREQTWLAGDAVAAVVGALDRRGATVSADEFRARVIARGIALSPNVSADVLRHLAREVVRRPEPFGLRRVVWGTELHFTTRAAGAGYAHATRGFERPESERRSAREHPRERGEPENPAPKAGAARGPVPNPRPRDERSEERAAARLREAVGNLKTAVKVRLLVTAARLLNRLAARVTGRRPRVVVDGRRIDAFLAEHRGGRYWRAQRAAWRAILTTPGGHLERGAAGEAAFVRALRRVRLPKGAVVTVTHGHAVTEQQLDALLALAVRDRARRVVLVDRPEFDRLNAAGVERGAGPARRAPGRTSAGRVRPCRDAAALRRAAPTDGGHDTRGDRERAR